MRISYLIALETVGRRSARQFISCPTQVWASNPRRLICPHIGLELKDNVSNFARSQVWIALQIEIITCPLGTDGRLMLKLRDLYHWPDADNNHYDKSLLCVSPNFYNCSLEIRTPKVKAVCLCVKNSTLDY